VVQPVLILVDQRSVGQDGGEEEANSIGFIGHSNSYYVLDNVLRLKLPTSWAFYSCRCKE